MRFMKTMCRYTPTIWHIQNRLFAIWKSPFAGHVGWMNRQDANFGVDFVAFDIGGRINISPVFGFP
jgi:hypothetical protein